MQEAVGGRIMVRGWPYAKMQDPIKKIPKAKGLECGSSGRTTCLPSIGPQVQTPVLPKKFLEAF
jgi:hypothetical protein